MTRQERSPKQFSLLRLIKSLGYALAGLKILIREEQNYLVHLTAASLALAAGWWFKISAGEWIAVVLSIQLVLSLETINTVIENVADLISTERSEAIKRIKDLAAASVLISAIAALVIGLIIFVPKLMAQF